MIKSLTLIPLVLVPVVTLGATAASGDPIQRSNWVPNVGERNFPEQPLGDMWTFRCPPGGTVSVSVDTKEETDDFPGESTLDPVLEIVDGQGNAIAFGDDDFDCTFPPVCGFSCPRVVDVPCGEGILHSIIVRDFGAAGVGCTGGGGYEMTVEIFLRGNQLPEILVGLGGGPRRHVPRWALEDGKAPVGPVLNDENVPNMEDASKE
jgi:hypothetical protein